MPKAHDAEDPAGGGEDEVGGLDEAISLLERHFARVDPVQVMALLPPDVPVSKLLRFLSSAVRHAEARRRNNQVCARIDVCLSLCPPRNRSRRNFVPDCRFMVLPTKDEGELPGNPLNSSAYFPTCMDVSTGYAPAVPGRLR